MSSAKKIVLPSVFTALLIGAQFVLSGVSGIEFVTVLLLTFAYCYGIKQGLLVANAFSLLRCFIFGFFPSVILLYLIYYNLFVFVFGLIGWAFKRFYSIKSHAITTVAVAAMTFSFTLIDDLITPLIYGFSQNATKVYFANSMPVALRQVIFAVASTVVLFPPLLKAMNSVRRLFFANA